MCVCVSVHISYMCVCTYIHACISVHAVNILVFMHGYVDVDVRMDEWVGVHVCVCLYLYSFSLFSLQFFLPVQ